MTQETQDTQDKDEESLVAHLEALREALIRCLTALVVVLPFTFYFSPKVIDYMTNVLIGNNKIKFNYFSPTEVFLLQIKMALLLAVVICFPYIAKKIWDFILPALYDNEQKFVKTVVFISSFLFLCGVAFCLFIILPLIINFGMGFSTSNIQAVFGITNVITLSLWLALVFGIMFQMPLVTYAMIKFGIVDYETISEKRPFVVVILLIVAAILTPPDIVSQVMLFMPTYALFEVGLLFSRNLGEKDED